MGGPQTERVRRLVVVFVDRAPIGAAELDGVGDNAGEHRVQVEGGVDCLADLPQGLQLFD